MATEDFLGCLSKAGIEKVGSSLSILPRPRAKDTRAEVIKQASCTTYVHPAALFALTEAELALHAQARREYSWGHDDPATDDQDGAGDGLADEAPAPTDRAVSMPSFDPDELGENGDGADENAHLDDELDDELDENEAPVVPVRSRPSRRKHAAAA